jgi:hypothetical protein
MTFGKDLIAPTVGSETRAYTEVNEGSISHRDDPSSFASMSQYDGLQELYVDKLLTASDEADGLSAQSPSLQDLGVFGRY